MRIPSLLSTTLALGAALGAGCGDDTLALQDTPAAYTAAYCSYLEHCVMPGTGSAYFRVIATNPGTFDCADILSRNGFLQIDELQASIDAGRLSYDAAAARRCVDGLGNTCMPLEVIVAGSRDCQDAFSGKVADGGDCTNDEECASASSTCVIETGCTGTCVAAAAIGASCSSASCASSADGSVGCTTTAENPALHCVLTRGAVADVGEPCGDTDTTGDDQTVTACKPGLYCKPGAGDTGICARPIALLGSCDPDADACAGNAFCTTSGGSSTCQKVTIVGNVGGACDEANRVVCNPLSRLACVSSTCVRVGTGVAGQPCRTGFATDCNEGFYCDDTIDTSFDGACVALLVDGQACDSSQQCQSGYCDDSGVDPVCGSPVCN